MKTKPLGKKRIEDAAKVLAQLIDAADAKTLGFADSPAQLMAGVLTFLHDSAEELREAQRKKAAMRVPLIAPRYAKTLAESIHAALNARGEGAAWAWGSVAMPALHSAYMSAGTATMSTHDAHPGSRAGVVIIDFRKLEDFADDAGTITAASVLARVRGEPKPKGDV